MLPPKLMTYGEIVTREAKGEAGEKDVCTCGNFTEEVECGLILQDGWGWRPSQAAMRAHTPLRDWHKRWRR